MGRDTWDVYFADRCIAKDMEIEDAILLVEALVRKYTEELRVTGEMVSIIWHDGVTE